MQETSITLVGNLAADPVLRRLEDGTELATFRVGCTPRRYDRAADRFVDGTTSWYQVTCWRALAVNAAASLRRGERVVVTGSLRLRPWERDGRSGTSADVVAEAVGHDLTGGTAAFTRAVRSERVDPPRPVLAADRAARGEAGHEGARLAVAVSAPAQDGARALDEEA